MAKTRLTDLEYKELLYIELAKHDGCGNSKTNFYTLLQTKYSLNKARALELHDRYFTEYQNSRVKAIVDTTLAKDIERLNKAIMSKDEAMELLTIIANDPYKLTPNGEASAKGEQIQAVKALSELQGWNAPTKQEVQVSKGATGIFIED